MTSSGGLTSDVVENEEWRCSPTSDRLLAVGDVHGDLDALLRILLGLAFIDDKGNWAAGPDHLVLTGDLNDRGPDSVDAITLVMRLEEQAAEAGGRVDCLLGNHEMMAVQQERRYVRPVEAIAFESFWFEHWQGLDAVYRHDSPWARWLRRRPTILRVGETLFCHASLGRWAIGASPSEINRIVRQWVAHFQGVSEPPDESWAWLIEQEGGGPLWNTDFIREGSGGTLTAALQPKELREVLAQWGARRLVCGHMVTAKADYRVVHPHPRHRSMVALIDTGISRAVNGRLTALEINGATLLPHEFARGDGDLALTREIRRRQYQARESLSL
jgi:hypothetical protein